MPNHLHGILWIKESPNLNFKINQFAKVTEGSIPNIVRCYKAIVTKQINQFYQQKGTSLISEVLNVEKSPIKLAIIDSIKS